MRRRYVRTKFVILDPEQLENHPIAVFIIFDKINPQDAWISSEPRRRDTSRETTNDVALESSKVFTKYINQLTSYNYKK